jgi:enoyl-CoA hydratase/carnithine racemase
MVALSRNVMPKHAMEMLLTGDILTADDACRIGLVNRVVSPNELARSVDEMARKIASKSMVTVRTGKDAFYRQIDLPLDAAYAYASGVMTENLLTRDAEEGIAAFIGKRPPNWSDDQ